jgi:hypothetical protein
MSRGFFFRIPSEIVESGLLQRIRFCDLKVYLVILHHANWRTGQAWPGWKLICQEAGISKTSLFQSIQRLRLMGLILVNHHVRKGRGNLYQIVRTPQISPDMIPSGKEPTPKKLERDRSGRMIPSGWTQPIPSDKEVSVPSYKEQNYSHERESLNEKRKAAFPISQKTLKTLRLQLGEEKLKSYMRDHGYDPAQLEGLTEGKDEVHE